MSNLVSLLLFFLLSSSTLLCVSSPVSAQSTLQGEVRLSTEEYKNFDVALKRLAEVARVTILVEGAPFTSKIEDEATIVEERRHGDLSQIIKNIAEAYDYEVEIGGTCVLFRKRYSHAGDLPCVTFDECKLILEELQQFARSVCGEINQSGDPIDVLGNTYFRSLTADARGRMIPVRSMNPAQRDALWRLMLYTSIGRLGETTVSPLNSMTKARSSILALGSGTGTDPLSGTATMLGYVDRTTPTGEFTPLAQGVLYATAVPHEGQKPRLVATETIESIVARLNTNPGGRDFQYEFDAELAKKPVTVFGPVGANADNIFTGLSRLYSLRIAKPTENIRRLVRYRLRPLSQSKDLKQSLNEFIPLPLARKLVGGPLLDANSPTVQERPQPPRGMQAITSLVSEAVRHLRLTQVKNLSNPASSPVIADLPASDKTAFAIAEMNKFLVELMRLLIRTPTVITEFENLLVTYDVNPGDDGDKISIAVSIQDKNSGKIRRLLGFSNMRILR
jgi:hypothetical protein